MSDYAMIDMSDAPALESTHDSTTTADTTAANDLEVAQPLTGDDAALFELGTGELAAKIKELEDQLDKVQAELKLREEQIEGMASIGSDNQVAMYVVVAEKLELKAEAGDLKTKLKQCMDMHRDALREKNLLQKECGRMREALVAEREEMQAMRDALAAASVQRLSLQHVDREREQDERMEG